MDFPIAKKLDIGSHVYPKATPDKILTVVSKKVVLKQPSLAQWWNIVLLTCDDGNEYKHSDVNLADEGKCADSQ